jgi:hypothetical protein
MILTLRECSIRGYARKIVVKTLQENGNAIPSEYLINHCINAYIKTLSDDFIDAVVKEKIDRHANRPAPPPTILDIAEKKLINPDNKLFILVKGMDVSDLKKLTPDEIDYSSYYTGIFPKNEVWDYFAYNLYEKSQLWYGKRKEVIALRGNKCQLCTIRLIEEIHHWTYKNFCHETPEDLWGLCNKCHDRIHEIRPTRSKILIVDVKK